MWQNIKDFFYRLWLSFVDFMQDLFLIVLDGVLSLVVVIFNGFDYALQALDITQYLDMLPDNVRGIMAALALGEALGIIATAIIIKITLQLIPFTRLGS